MPLDQHIALGRSQEMDSTKNISLFLKPKILSHETSRGSERALGTETAQIPSK